MDDDAVADLLALQQGVVSRRQVLGAGGSDVDIERLLRRREWARVHEGVYVDHTGPLTRDQRLWAAVLVHWPAALAASSALGAHGLRTAGTDDGVVEVAVAEARRVDALAGIRPSRLRPWRYCRTIRR